MMVVDSMDDVAAVLEVLCEFEDQGSIVIVRAKDRFVRAPSPGGWRDVMVNFYVVADTSKHVAELQVVHDRMLIARKGLNGHEVYHRSRNALELLVRHFDRNKAAAGDAMAL